MKILVKGNIIARGTIGIMNNVGLIQNCEKQNEKDFDIVIYGDLELDSLWVNDNVQLYSEGSMACLGMTEEQIKATKGE